MARSYLTLTGNTPVMIGYICSSCGNPILASVIIQCKAETSYAFAQGRAEENAREIMKVVTAAGVDLIQNAFDTKRSLVAPMGVKQDVSIYGSGSVVLAGASVPCPTCGNLEIWQKNHRSSSEVERVARENYPQLLQDEKTATLWALQKVDRSIEEYRRYWAQHTQELEKLQSQKTMLENRIASMKADVEGLPEHAMIKSLLEEHTEIAAQIKQTRAFSLERKEYKALAADKERQMLHLKKKLDEKAVYYNEQIKSDEAQLDDVRKQMVGSTGESTIDTKANVISFRIL